MKKMITAIMVGIMMMSMGTTAYAKEIGAFESDMILRGNYEVVELNKKATMSEWSEPDLFGNQYRLYTYITGDAEEVVCLKHHCTREEAKSIKAAAKK